MLEPYVFKETRTVPRRGEMSNHLFLFDNNMLSRYNDLYEFFSSHDCPLNPNIGNLNAILKMLKQEYSFLREGESTSQQQVFRDLNKAFTSFFKGKSAYPKFKSKKNPKQSFRIQKKTETIFA
jgi:putative transposase